MDGHQPQVHVAAIVCVVEERSALRVCTLHIRIQTERSHTIFMMMMGRCLGKIDAMTGG